MQPANIFADPPNDGPEIGTLVIIVDRAKNLPNRKSTKQNPYCQARLGKFCAKTKTDKRGGQTPRWDEELRFTAHDSADYYNLKLSIFNDDKKTDLIGEAWVELRDVIVPGGGQSDFWQELKLQRKYAGEVRVELTYYDSRPRVEKPAAPRRSSTRDMQWETESSFGGRPQGYVKRRPLPSNPTSVNSTPHDQARLQASGPRQFGTPQSTQPRARRDTENSTGRYSVDSRRQLPSRQSMHSAMDDEYNNTQRALQPFTSEHSYENHEQEHYSLDHDDHHSQTSFASGGFMNNMHNEYMSDHGTVDPHQYLHHSYSAPTESDMEPYEDLPILRPRSASEFQNGYSSQPVQQWPVDDPFGPDHPQSIQRSQEPHATYNGQASGYIEHEDFDYDSQHRVQPNGMHEPEDQFYDEAPPPPPSHRHTTNFSNSSPGHSMALQSWTQPTYEQHDSWDSPRGEIYAKGHHASKSEVVLSTYRDDFDPDNHDFEQQARRSHNSQSHYQQDGYGIPRSSSPPSFTNNFPVTAPNYHYSPSEYSGSNSRMSGRRNSSYDDRTMSDFGKDNYSPRELSQSEHKSPLYKRNTQTYPPPIMDGPHSHRNSLQSSPNTLNGASNQGTPGRPHPLSQHLTLSSSPHASSPHDSMPIIKPLAISPAKSNLTTPKSQTGSPWSTTNRNTIPRKSVSPMGSLGKADGRSGMPYSPDSLIAINPAVQNSTKPAEQIVDFHGNVVDPSDRLPETSWAPEPSKSNKESTPTHIRSSPWGSETESNRPSGSRSMNTRARERITPAREVELRENLTPSSSPLARTSMYPSSPLNGSPKEPSPYTRNRLTKRATNRPQPVASSPSWSQPLRDIPQPPIMSSPPYQQAAPLVPAKIPLDSKHSSPNSGVYFTNTPAENNRDDPYSLNSGMQGMNLGTVSKRINGRRLLGW